MFPSSEIDTNVDYLQPRLVVKSVNELPDEVLLQIFSYLSIRDMCYSVTYVCEKWHCLTQDQILWKRLHFICDKDMAIQYIIDVLSKASMLKNIELQWRIDTDVIVESLCRHCRGIRNLSMICCGQIKASSMQLLANQFTGLKTLNMDKCWCIEPPCYDMVCQFHNLESVNLSHSKRLDGILLRQIVDACRHLTHINIDYVRGIPENDIVYLIDVKKTHLLSFIFFGDCVSDATFHSLESCTRLHTLYISSCQLITDQALISIAKLLTLKSLKLRLGSNLKGKSLANFLLTKVASNLECLIISRCPNFDDEGARNISLNCLKLKHIELVYCPKLTEEVLENIVKCCKLLKVVYFRENASPYRLIICIE